MQAQRQDHIGRDILVAALAIFVSAWAWSWLWLAAPCLSDGLMALLALLAMLTWMATTRLSGALALVAMIAALFLALRFVPGRFGLRALALTAIILATGAYVVTVLPYQPTTGSWAADTIAGLVPYP